MATPFQQASKLWSPESTGLSPNEFQSRFDGIYAAATDLATLWQLGGAASDYLRFNPNGVAVPDSLPEVLLQSEQVDARIIGLKLMNRLKRPATQTVRWLALALASVDENELLGGLHEVGEFLPRADANTDLESVKVALSSLADSRNNYVRERAARLLRQLVEPA